METLKNKIKALAEGQASLKNQRKTINIVGERKMTPSEAFEKHKNNRVELREMYMAYGILKGKTQEEIENNPKTPINMKRVEKIVESFKVSLV